MLSYSMTRHSGLVSNGGSSRLSRPSIARNRPSVFPLRASPLPDVPKERGVGSRGREWLQKLFLKFGSFADRSKTNLVLDFEKKIIDLDGRIEEVRRVAEEIGVDVNEQVQLLEERSKQLRKETYSKLTPNQRLQVARHPNRPTSLDIIMSITDKFIELHGDRAGHDDKAIVCGLGTIDDVSIMFIGHQKGRNTKENVERNFGMAQPSGFRKALRFMQHANKFGFPIVTLVDTPGAYAGRKAEETGQAEAIARNLREMFNLTVPVISVVIGEGGSGGALAINCANKVLIMENAVYYVASPEACAAILWKSRDKAAEAAEALKITANDLITLGIVDEVIPEPLGGSHSDPAHSFPPIKEAVMRWLEHYNDMERDDIAYDRYKRYRKFGEFSEFMVRGGEYEKALKKRNESEGVYTKVGTWCVDEEEAEYIEQAVDLAEKWKKNLEGKEEWLMKPDIPGDQADPPEEFLEKMKAEEEARAVKKETPSTDKESGPAVDPLEVDAPRDVTKVNGSGDFEAMEQSP